MVDLLALTSLERTADPKIMRNRCQFFSPPNNASYRGEACEIRMACVRIVDGLRMRCEHRDHNWLREWSVHDTFEVPDLVAAYAPNHDIHRLDLSDFDRVRSCQAISEVEFQRLLGAAIRRNFKRGRCYVTSNDRIEYGDPKNFDHSYLNRSIRTIFLNLEANRTIPTNTVIVPGWSDKTQRKWIRENKDWSPEDMKSGRPYSSLTRLIPINSENCVEGGRHV